MGGSDLERVAVVAAFLSRGRRILLLRRSAQVGTYRGRWAGVSGYVERVPLEQALTELQEEVRIEASEVRLRGIGAPVPVDDDDEGRRWLVYPFLFAFAPPREPEPDWESVESRWVKPEEVRELPTVPGLADVVAAVWPPFGSVALWRAAVEIAGDRVSGATSLAARALNAFRRYASAREANDRPDLRVRVARALAALRPSMGIIPHVMARAVSDEAPDSTEIERELAEAAQRTAARAGRRLSRARRILTHSASAVCEEALLRWAKSARRAEVIVTESRPRQEGVALAHRLTSAGLRVRLITDAQMGLAVREVDAVVVGADAITDDNQLLNKAGTRLAVLAAREAGVPAHAVCQTHKIAPPGWPMALERQDPADVAEAQGFRLDNVAFDATPLDWFAAVITEEGRLTPRLLARTRAVLSRSALVP